MEKINEHNQNRDRSLVANDGMNGRDGLNGKPAERTSCYNRNSKSGLSGKKGKIVIRYFRQKYSNFEETNDSICTHQTDLEL